MTGNAHSSARHRPALLSLGVAALFVGIGVVPAALTGAGCATQETTPAPDATPPPCDPGPRIFCEPNPEGQPGCNTSDGTSEWLQRLPPSTRYPVDCVAYVLIERNQDTLACDDLRAVCKCVVAAVPAPASDAGSTGDAGDGDAAPPPPPPGETKPIWNCTP